MSIQVHMNNDGSPIFTSAICSRCEADAGHRMRSYMQAKADSKDYNGKSRQTVDKASGLHCFFCGRKS